MIRNFATISNQRNRLSLIHIFVSFSILSSCIFRDIAKNRKIITFHWLHRIVIADNYDNKNVTMISKHRYRYSVLYYFDFISGFFRWFRSLTCSRLMYVFSSKTIWIQEIINISIYWYSCSIKQREFRIDQDHNDWLLVII